MRDVSALHTLYSALIQATATIVAIFAGLLAISTFRGHQWGKLYGDSMITTREVTQSLAQLKEIARATQPDDEKGQQPIQFQMDERTQQLFDAQRAIGEQIQEHILATLDYKLIRRALLFLGLFGIVLPSILLALLPHDPAPFLRSYFALAGYAFSLLGILLLVTQLGPSTDMRFASKRSEFIQAWNVLSVLLALCLLGVVFAHLLPFPTG
jgi:hypothetical protein